MSKTLKDTRKYRSKIAMAKGCIVGEVGGIPSKFKRFQRKSRKAAERMALRCGREIPIFRRTDAWDFY